MKFFLLDTLYLKYSVSQIFCILDILYLSYSISQIFCILDILYLIYSVSYIYSVSQIFCILDILYLKYLVANIIVNAIRINNRNVFLYFQVVGLGPHWPSPECSVPVVYVIMYPSLVRPSPSFSPGCLYWTDYSCSPCWWIMVYQLSGGNLNGIFSSSRLSTLSRLILFLFLKLKFCSINFNQERSMFHVTMLTIIFFNMKK